MIRKLLSIPAYSPKCLSVIQTSFFGSNIYVRNKSKGIVLKMHQKSINLNNLNKEAVTSNQQPSSESSTPFAKENSYKPAVSAFNKSNKFDNKVEKGETGAAKQGSVNVDKKDNISESENPTMQDRALTREKQLSVKLLKAKTKEEVMNIYDKAILHIKPIHISIAFAQVIKLLKMEQKLKNLMRKTSQKNRVYHNYSLWEDEKFMQIYKHVLENIENMNPDSIAKILSAIHLKRSKQEEFKVIYDRIVNWLASDQNALLLDKLQALKVLVSFSKLASREFYANPKNSELMSLLISKMKNDIPTFRTQNILRVYQACLRMKNQDTKLYAILNAQIRKRIKHIFPQNIILCCAANLVPKHDTTNHFIQSMIAHMIKADMTTNMRLKDLINLLTLISQVLESKMEDGFKQDCRMLTDVIVKKIIDKNQGYIKRGGRPKKAAEAEQSETTDEAAVQLARRLAIVHFDRLLRGMMILEKYDKNMVNLIEIMLSNAYMLSIKDIIYIITYLLEFQKRSQAVPHINQLVISAFLKLEDGASKLSGHSLQLAHYMLRNLLEQNKSLLETAIKAEGFVGSIQQILRKFLHSFINSNYKFTLPMLASEAEFLDIHRSIEVNKTKLLEPLEFYVRSIRKNIIQPLLVSSTEDQESPDAARLKLTTKQVSNIISSLWVLTAVFSKEFPVMTNAAIFQEYAHLIQQHIDFKKLSIEDIDKLSEVYYLFVNSFGGNYFWQMFKTDVIEDMFDERLKTVQEHNLKRRKPARTAFMSLATEVIGSENVKVSENVLLPEDILADLLIEKDNKKYVVLFHNYYAKEKQSQLFKVLQPESVSTFVSPLKQRVLEYRGYKPLFISLKDWANLNAEEKKNEIKNFFEI